MRYQLEIELLSVASPGSGEDWAGMIDSDIVFDEFGLPYIPARRIKGIVREMANDVAAAFQKCLPQQKTFDDKTVSELFGEQGRREAAAIAFHDAHLEDYEALKIWMQWARAHVPNLAAAENVIAVFTQVRPQTAIDENKGVAKEHSLRLTRVLRKGCKFVAAVDFGHSNDELKNLLALAVGVTRALGGKRNRGLGKIKCALKDANNELVAAALKEFRPKLLGKEASHEPQ